MGYWNLEGVWVCECACSECEDAYFSSFGSTRQRFRPPDLREFLLELLNDWSKEPAVKAAQEREERVQDRASTSTVALDAGTNRPLARDRPIRRPW